MLFMFCQKLTFDVRQRNIHSDGQESYQDYGREHQNLFVAFQKTEIF